MLGQLSFSLNSSKTLLHSSGLENLNPGNPRVNWNRTYGGSSTDDAYDLIQTMDGGFVLAGHTWSQGAGLADMWIVKTYKNGIMQWNNTYGTFSYEFAYTIVETQTQEFLLAGSIRTYKESINKWREDLWLIKTDSKGDMLWNQTIGGMGFEEGSVLIQTIDGGFALAGYTSSTGGGNWDFWLIKLDENGFVQWNQTYGVLGTEKPNALLQTSDQGYLLAGYKYTYVLPHITGDAEIWLVKTDMNGKMQWNQTYGGSGDEMAYALIETRDGGFALAGDTSSFGSGSEDMWLVKTNSHGIMEWNRTYGGSGSERAEALLSTSDGEYLLTGYTYEAGDSDAYIVKTNSTGDVLWDLTLGGEGNDRFRDVVQNKEGDFFLAGRTASFEAASYDFWFVMIGKPSDQLIPNNVIFGGIFLTGISLGVAVLVLFQKKR